MGDRSRPWILLVISVALGLAAIAAVWLTRRDGRVAPPAEKTLPGPGSETYREMVSAFYVGVAALDADARETAGPSLTRAVELVPEEPAAWANRGLLKLRAQDHDGAAGDLEQALRLAPESGAIEKLLGLLESRRGDFASAIAHLLRAVELSPGDLKSRFALAHEIERQGEPGADAEALRQLDELVRLRPENLAVLVERGRLAAKRGDAEVLSDTVTRLGRLAPSWPQRAQDVHSELEKAANANPRTASTRVIFLRNVLLQTPAFRRSLAEVETPAIVVGEPLESFLRLPTPSPTPAPIDEAITFAAEPLSIAEAGAARWDFVSSVSLTGQGPPVLLVADGRTVRRVDESKTALPFPGGSRTMPPSPSGVLAVDWNSDYRMDLVLAGAGGVRVFQQNEDGSFADATAATKLEPGILGIDAYGVWAADIEMDGDLDLVLGARQGNVSVLRNNGDGTFGTIQPFEGMASLRDFVWADLDGDGDPDAAMLDERAGLRIYTNERAGRFVPRPGPESLGTVAGLANADMNSDGVIDLVALRPDGALLRISDKNEGQAWETAVLARITTPVGNPTRLFIADLDNNGALDVIAEGASGRWIGMGGDSDQLHALAAPTDLRILAIADLNADGRLDLVGLSRDGQPSRGLGKGSREYHWQVIRPRGARTFGDGRINSFGIGGEVEVRAGLLVQKQAITEPVLHFGLGDRPDTDVARIVWPNGTAQAEFAAPADREILAEQRLKGSCPFLYAFDGSKIRFVTDFIWRSPLGLRINAQDTAGVAQTEDWVKIRGDQLAPRDGFYDIRITGELWETHYWDHIALLVIDHPRETEVFVDERFARRPPPMAVQPTGPLYPVAYARDDRGRDVTEQVAARDSRYLDCPMEGFYQGVTRDHWVEAEISDDVPRDRLLKLVAHGWIHPTDSSINVAISQSGGPKPQGLVLEVPTGDGGWRPARADLGFPAGKDKTILVDLDGAFPAGAPRRFRLRTNLEVHWDSLAVAASAPESPLETRRIAPASAELRARGYSRMGQADASSPEIPDYDVLTGAGQHWRDLIGYYTRFGDVKELIEKVDDRYVIANAGDELALRFPAPDLPRDGWARDFVLIGDGWNKDGDYNTAYSKTVLPLPSHRDSSYERPPGSLEDDPVFRLHAEDWRLYHTRYITPSDFQLGPRPR